MASIDWRITLYLIKKLHQITAIMFGVMLLLWLYLIKKLHQITARDPLQTHESLLYLIKKLHQITADYDGMPY